jgi:hypothetical protein
MTQEITPKDSACPIYLEPADPAQFEADQKEMAARQKKEADRAKLKSDTIAKLGLTADEVAALLS